MSPERSADPFSLFVDAHRKWAWILTYIGIAILVIEILSRIRFIVDTKLTHLLGMIVLFAAGCALMFRSYRDGAATIGIGDLIGESPQDDEEEDHS